jgi:hypothetical protein
MQGFDRAREKPAAQKQWEAMEKTMRRTMETVGNPGEGLRRVGDAVLKSFDFLALFVRSGLDRLLPRPARARGHPRLSAGAEKQDVDGRDKGEPSGLAFGKPKGELRDAVLRTAMPAMTGASERTLPVLMDILA